MGQAARSTSTTSANGSMTFRVTSCTASSSVLDRSKSDVTRSTYPNGTPPATPPSAGTSALDRTTNSSDPGTNTGPRGQGASLCPNLPHTAGVSGCVSASSKNSWMVSFIDSVPLSFSNSASPHIPSPRSTRCTWYVPLAYGCSDSTLCTRASDNDDNPSSFPPSSSPPSPLLLPPKRVNPVSTTSPRLASHNPSTLDMRSFRYPNSRVRASPPSLALALSSEQAQSTNSAAFSIHSFSAFSLSSLASFSSSVSSTAGVSVFAPASLAPAAPPAPPAPAAPASLAAVVAAPLPPAPNAPSWARLYTIWPI